MVQKSTAVRTLKQILRERLKTERTTPPLDETSWLRASALADLCPREEVIAARTQLVRTEVIKADLSLIFAHGHGLHWTLQHHVLPEADMLLGQWRCMLCATLHGGVELHRGEPQSEQYVPRPRACAKCGQADPREFHYVEQYFRNAEYRIGGHPDGFLRMAGMEGLGILEAKSASARASWEIKTMPQLSHVVQAHVYMWFTGFTWAKILYWEKGGNGIDALIEHTIARDEETIHNIKVLIASIWRALRRGPLPARICDAATDPLAKECPVAATCFDEARWAAQDDWSF